MTIVKCTKVRLKRLKVLTGQRNRCCYSQHVCDVNNIILNNKRSRKWFKFQWVDNKYQTFNKTCDAQTKIPKRRTTEVV